MCDHYEVTCLAHAYVHEHIPAHVIKACCCVHAHVMSGAHEHADEHMSAAPSGGHQQHPRH
jgi:hypothetical protein